MNLEIKATAVLPQGLEQEGADELRFFGAKNVRPFRRIVFFEADLACFYRLHLQARLPFRILREMARFKCFDRDSLYLGIQEALNWDKWLHPSMSFRVDISGKCFGLPHTHFTALEVKNALVDLQRDRWCTRSDINLKQPDLCLHVHLSNDIATLSLDGSRQSLHRRGYKLAVGNAPLKENLAAGLIRLTGWNGLVPLVDPLCGSGTFLLEAASMALQLVPGIKQSFLFHSWVDFDQNLWNYELELAKSKELTCQHLPKIVGCEQVLAIAGQARQNLSNIGLENKINIQISHFRELSMPEEKGIIVCNPPYGKRIGHEEDLVQIYKELGHFCKQKASGWELWLLSGNPKLSKFLGMKCNRRFPVNNGGIDCRWLNYSIH